MRHFRDICILCGLFFSCDLWAQEDHLVRLDTSSLDYFTVGEGLPTADGGSILEILQPGSFSLWKCDASGQAQWRNSYPSLGAMTSWDIAPTNSGDVLFVSSGHAQLGTGMNDIPFWELRRIAQDGTVLWRKRVELDSISPGFTGFHKVGVVEGEGSDLFVTWATGAWPQTLVTVTKLDATGTFLWSRHIGDIAQMMSFPAQYWMGEDVYYFAPDQLGGCRLVAPSAGSDDERMCVLSLAPDGSLDWARLFDRLGPDVYCKMTAPAVANDGSTLFFAHIASESATHMIRISSSGDLMEVRQDPLGGFSGSLRNDQGNLFMLWGGSIITMSENAELLTVSGFGPLPAGQDSTYFLQYNHLEVSNGRGCFAGSYIATPFGGGQALASPAIASFDLNSTSCGRTGQALNGDYNVLPNTLFTCLPMPTMVSDTLHVVVSDAALDHVQRPVFDATDLCIYTAITPVPAGGPSYTVSRTLLGVGEPLVISSTDPVNAMLIDPRGALIWQSTRTFKSIEIPTEGVAPGIYVVIFCDLTGQALRTVKVTISH